MRGTGHDVGDRFPIIFVIQTATWRDNGNSGHRDLAPRQCDSRVAAPSPDLNPIEMAFAKLKTLLRKQKARTYEDLWKAVGKVCDLFTRNDCWNSFKEVECVAC